MIIKHVSPFDTDWEYYPLSVANRNDTNLVKSASCWYVAEKHDPDHTFVNALFLGAGDFYGCNRNGDYFEDKELLDHHQSFLEAHHFKHHDNKPTSEKFGNVTQVYYCPDMHRVEGVIKIINSKSPEMVKKIDKGIPVPLSMACKVPYDVCSICGNKARTRAQYCDHLLYDMSKIYDDGRMVFAFNPKPKFFDISEVVRGADPTAFTLRKVASLQEKLQKVAACKYTLNRLEKHIALSDIDIYNTIQKCAENTQTTQIKLSVLKRLAELEKRIEGIAYKDPASLRNYAKGCGTKKLSLNTNNTSDLIGALSESGIALKPEDIGASNINKKAMYRTLLNSKYRDTVLKSLPERGEICYNNSLSKEAYDRSLKTKYVTERTELNLFKQCSLDLTDYTNNEEVLCKVAAINLAVVCNNPSLLDDNNFMNMLVIQNLTGS